MKRKPTVGKRERFITYARDRFQCVFCRRSVLLGQLSLFDLTVDHWWPLCQGGHPYRLRNLRTACRACNTLKGDATFDTLDDAREYIEQQRAVAAARMIEQAAYEVGDTLHAFDWLDLEAVLWRLGVAS